MVVGDFQVEESVVFGVVRNGCGRVLLDNAIMLLGVLFFFRIAVFGLQE